MTYRYVYLKFFSAMGLFCALAAPVIAEQVKLKTILVLGDSLSASYKLSTSVGWVQLLQERLEQEALPYHVVNASISGATTAAGLQLLPKSLEQHRPDIVILELGANDGLQGKPVPYITKNLRQLIQLSQQAGAQVLLVGIRLPPNFGARYTEPFFKQFAQLAEEENIALLPFLLEGVAGHQELMLTDGLHPRPEGQRVVLENVWPHLQTLFGNTAK